MKSPLASNRGQDHWTSGLLNVSNKSHRKFQALTSSRLCRLAGTETLFGPFTYVEACRDLQEGRGGCPDLFNVLICLSSLSWPYYCPSPKANTWKHWPAGPRYWFIRWSPVVVKSLSHTQDIINSDLSAPVCAYTHKMCLRILSNPSGLMALTKETNRMVLGTLLEVFPRNRTQGKAGGSVQLEVNGGDWHVIAERSGSTGIWVWQLLVNLLRATPREWNVKYALNSERPG